jgi:hypothetical protein
MSTEQNLPAVQMGLPEQMGVMMGASPKLLYMNGFKVGYSATDVFIVLQRNGSDMGVLNISYTLAKTLSEALQTLIKELEQKTGQTIMTAQVISTAMSRPLETKSA